MRRSFLRAILMGVSAVALLLGSCIFAALAFLTAALFTKGYALAGVGAVITTALWFAIVPLALEWLVDELDA